VFYGWPIAAAGALGVLMSVPGQTMGVSVFTDSLLTASFRVRPPVQVYQGAGVPLAERSQSDLALPR
jgi:hypothetical protein